jgi:hypothetical protein
MLKSANKTIIRIAAYVVLVTGILSVLTLLIVGVALLVSYPDATLGKKLLVIGLIFVFSAIVALVFWSIYRSLLEVVKIDQEIVEIMEHEKDQVKSGTKDV